MVLLRTLAFALLVAACQPMPSDWLSPREALEAARKEGLTSGRVFNDYAFGGFLIDQGIPTFFDGRAVVFAEPLFSDYLLPTPDKMDAMIEKYQPTWALIKPGGVIELYFLKRGWRRVYGDREATVYTKIPEGEVGK